MKGMIFTTDAIFALVIVGAAISIVVYFNYSTQSTYSLAGGQAQSILTLLTTTKVGSVAGASLGAFAQCNPAPSAVVLQAAVQYYLNASGSCATYLLDSVDPASNYGVFINSLHAPNVAYFNGATSQVNVPTAPSLNIPTTLTISMWVEPTGQVPGYASHLINKWTGISDANYVLYYFGITSGSSQYIQFYANQGGTWGQMGNGYYLTLNQWYHIVLSYSSATGGILYINGLADGGPVGGGTLATSSANLNMGEGTFPGYITNVQLYNTALTSGQVASLYQEGIAGQPISSAGNVGWWLLESDTADYSGNNNAGMPTGLTYAPNNYVSPSLPNGYGVYGAYAPSINTAYFNGQSSNIITGTTGLPVGSAARSVFAWVNYASSSCSCSVYGWGTSSADEESVLRIDAPVLTLSVIANTISSTMAARGANNGAGIWHFVGYTYAAGSTTVNFYIDGNVQAVTLPGALNTVTSNAIIGGYPQQSSALMNGSISNVQAYNTALSAAQVSQLYQEGIAGPPVSGSGNVGWWLLEGDTRDYSGYNNTGVPSNVVYTNGNYIPSGFKIAYSVSRAGTLLPFSKYASAYSTNSIYTYSPKSYNVGVYTWR